MKLTLPTLFALLAMAGPPVQALDLMEALRAAERHDPEFAVAQAQADAGRTRSRQGKALSAPQVNANLGAGYLDQQMQTRGAAFSAPGFGSSSGVGFDTSVNGGASTRWSINARQSLYDLELSANARQLERGATVAEAQYALARQELFMRVAQTYFDVLLAEDAVALVARQKAAARRSLEEAAERFDAGDTPVTDMREAQARLDAILAQELATQSDLDLKRAAFTDLTQLSADKLDRFASTKVLSVAELEPLQNWLTRAAERSPVIAMQSLGAENARDEIEKYKALTSPKVDLVAQIGMDRARGSGDFGYAQTAMSNRVVGIQISIPLFTGGMRDAKRDEAAALAERAQADLARTRQIVERQTRAAWTAVRVGAAQVRAFEQALVSAKSRLEATELGVEAGDRTTLNLLDAQTAFHAADSNWTRTRYEWLLSRIRLAVAAGEAGEDTLQAAAAVLGKQP